MLTARCYNRLSFITIRSIHPEVFLRTGVLKIYSKFTGEHPWRRVISIKLLCNFIETALWHGCPPVHLLHIFKTPFPRNTSGWLLLDCHIQFPLLRDSSLVHVHFPLSGSNCLVSDSFKKGRFENYGLGKITDFWTREMMWRKMFFHNDKFNLNSSRFYPL